jgi:ribosomal RNA-processing protein 12
MCAAIIMQSVSGLAESSENQRRKSGDNDPRLIHALQLVRTLAGVGYGQIKELKDYARPYWGFPRAVMNF